MKKEWISKREFARRIHRDVSRVYGKLKGPCDRGEIPIKKGKIEYYATKVWWEQNTKSQHTAKKYLDAGQALGVSNQRDYGRSTRASDGINVQSYRADIPAEHISRAKKEAANAEIQWLKAQELQGELINKREVEKTIFELGRKIRDSLLAMPARLAGTLAVETDQRVIQHMMEAELMQALQGLEGVK